MKITRKIVDEIFEHGRREAPIEACGYLAGKRGLATRYFPMKNADQSRKHFSLDPAEQFLVIREARAEKLEIVAICHTHPETPARPSDEDIRLAYDPNMIYVITSIVNGMQDIRAFHIAGRKVTPVEITMEEGS
ncbi:MAG: M67 family metallopeptidase [Victivallales bacterium]